MRSAGARGPCPPGQETGPRAPRRQGSGGVQPTGSTETGSVIAPALGATTGIREPPRPAFLHPTTRPPGVPLRHARVSHPHPPLLARPTPRRFAQPYQWQGPRDEDAHRGDHETTGHRRTGALHQPYYDRLDAVFAGCSADEIAVLHDWFSRSTNLALAHVEELRATDADGE